MFDDKTKNAWQAITPDPALREKALAQAGGEPPVKKASVRPFLNLLRVTASIAACIALALVLLRPGRPQVTFTGVQPGAAIAAFSQRSESAWAVTLVLEAGKDTVLTTGEGVLEADGSTFYWRLPGPGDYTLTASRGSHSSDLHFSVAYDEGWSVKCSTLRP